MPDPIKTTLPGFRYYDTPAGHELRRRLAERDGRSESQWIARLVRAEARRQGVQVPAKG